MADENTGESVYVYIDTSCIEQAFDNVDVVEVLVPVKKNSKLIPFEMI